MITFYIEYWEEKVLLYTLQQKEGVFVKKYVYLKRNNYQKKRILGVFYVDIPDSAEDFQSLERVRTFIATQRGWTLVLPPNT